MTKEEANNCGFHERTRSLHIKIPNKLIHNAAKKLTIRQLANLCVRLTNLCFTTDKPVFTTDKPVFTTCKPLFTTDKPVFTTDKPVFTIDTNLCLQLTPTCAYN
jgi:hypothetical protein